MKISEACKKKIIIIIINEPHLERHKPFLSDCYFPLVFKKFQRPRPVQNTSPIMVSPSNPFPLISLQPPHGRPGVGVLFEPVPQKTLEWKALFQLCTKLDCVLVSRGAVCFCHVSLLQRSIEET